jgi:hypothetical protein
LTEKASPPTSTFYPGTNVHEIRLLLDLSGPRTQPVITADTPSQIQEVLGCSVTVTASSDDQTKEHATPEPQAVWTAAAEGLATKMPSSPKLNEINESNDSADPAYDNILNCHYDRKGQRSLLCRCCHKIFSEKKYSSMDTTRHACVQHVRWCEKQD